MGETDVHYPTDVNLLWDATRVAVREVAKLADKHDVKGWRQVGHRLRGLRKLYHKVSRKRDWHARHMELKAYLKECRELASSVRTTVEALESKQMPADELNDIKTWLDDNAMLRDQVGRYRTMRSCFQCSSGSRGGSGRARRERRWNWACLSECWKNRAVTFCPRDCSGPAET